MTYTILLQKNGEGYTATVPYLPDCKTTGKTEQEAIDNIRLQIKKTISQVKVLSVDIDVPDVHHAWEPFAGMWQNDPSFEDFQSEIDTERARIDAEEQTV